MRDVVGYEGIYQVTEDGQIWNVKYKRFLKQAGGKGNYQMVFLHKDGKGTCEYVHRIVAKAYIPNPNNYPEVNHKDEVKDHNHWTNLEWCNKHYNLAYSNVKLYSRGVPVYCVELDKTFPSLTAAAKETGVHPPNLSALVRNKTLENHILGGYHWRLASLS